MYKYGHCSCVDARVKRCHGHLRQKITSLSNETPKMRVIKFLIHFWAVNHGVGTTCKHC